MSDKDVTRGLGGRLMPDYWCTWATQNRLVAEDRERLQTTIAGDQGAFRARNNLNEELVFGADGWASRMCRGYRKNLFLLLDDGWDVPYDSHPDRNLEAFGLLEPWPERFSSFGGTALERLREMNRRAQEAGWQGVGLWIAAQRDGDRHGALAAGVEEHYRRQLELSAAAGVRYWKVDWGVRGGSNAFREMVSRLAREICPELWVEHCPLDMRALNGLRLQDGELVGTGRAETSWDDAELVERCRFSDIVRTYDVLRPLSDTTTLDRAVGYLGTLERHRLSGTLLNVEDSPVIGAVLGCAFGIMRQTDGSNVSGDMTCRRAVAWHGMAPPFGWSEGVETVFSEASLEDWHAYAAEEIWLRDVWGHCVRQGAPATVARGLSLPEVCPLGSSRPYVLAGRHPNGAVSVGVLPRVSGEVCETPAAEVRLREPLDWSRPVAVFGELSSLCVPWDGGSVRLRVSDLGGGSGHEVEVSGSGGVLRLDCGQLRAVAEVCPEGTPAVLLERVG